MWMNQRPIGKIVLCLVGSFTLTMSIRADPAEPPTSGPASVKDSEANQERFLLLTDGRLIHGVVSQEDSSYVVDQRLGVIRFSKNSVEGVFRSIGEAYRHRLEQLAERDPAERMDLARWCLNLNLTAEAKEQLRKVLQLSPEHGQAKAMLTKINQWETLAARRQRDPEVQQARAEEVIEDRPGALDSAVIRAQRGMGISGLPVIFDLPPALAVKRADEFARHIHPVLQFYCAKCHDTEHDSAFQLVSVRNRRERTPDALRANLDATLHWIDRANPPESKLLSITLRPHGRGANKRPIFSGSNDRAYQILAAWVNNLRPLPKRDEMREEPDRSGIEQADRFASDRARVGQGGEERTSVAYPATDVRRTLGSSAPAQTKIPSSRYVPGVGMVAEDQLPTDPREFPLPPLLGGPMPRLTSGTTTPKTNSQAPSNTSARSSGSSATVPAKATTIPVDGSTKGGSGAAAQGTSEQKPSVMSKKTKKPLDLDPAIIERMLRLRNEGR
jgi:hypothetical protein